VLIPYDLSFIDLWFLEQYNAEDEKSQGKFWEGGGGWGRWGRFGSMWAG